MSKIILSLRGSKCPPSFGSWQNDQRPKATATLSKSARKVFLFELSPTMVGKSISGGRCRLISCFLSNSSQHPTTHNDRGKSRIQTGRASSSAIFFSTFLISFAKANGHPVAWGNNSKWVLTGRPPALPLKGRTNHSQCHGPRHWSRLNGDPCRKAAGEQSKAKSDSLLKKDLERGFCTNPKSVGHSCGRSRSFGSTK